MNEIEKQIEEMAKVLDEEFALCGIDSCKDKKCSHCYANHLVEAGYRNVKDKVVLSREEYEKLKAMADINIDIVNLKSKVQEALNFNPIEDIIKTEQIARKETAKEIFQKLIGYTIEEDGWTWCISKENIEEIIKQYGVEVE